MRGPLSLFSIAFSAAILAGCATAQQNYALAAVVAGGALVLSDQPDAGWDTKSLEEGARRYRIQIRRVAWTGSGEGDFGRRFEREAQRIASERKCNGYRVLAYSERYESALTGASRIAEGTIECA